jgi:hypothetical protein
MAGVVLSYRRDETAGHAGRLYADLVRQFGAKRVFRDVDTLEPGVNFVEAIRRAVGASDVLIALIGRHWLTASDAEGNRRLDDPRDYVRLEIETALLRGIPVIPVLVQAAAMPAPEDLPAPLTPLAYQQAHELSESRWDYDVSRLVEALEKLGLKAQAPSSSRDDGRAPPRRGGVLAAIMSVLLVGGMLVAAVLGWWAFEEGAARSKIRFWLDCEAVQGTAACTQAFGPLQRTVDDCASHPLLGRDTCDRLLREERAARQR